MPRFRQLVKRDKHETTWSNIGQDASTATIEVVLLKGVDVGAKLAGTDNAVGSHVRSIYFEFHFSPAQTGNVNVIHWEVVGVLPNQTLNNPSVYYQDERSQIMKRGMEMLPTNVSTVFKRIFVVKMPRKFQRIQQGFEVRFRYQASSTQTINACGIVIYKEIY